jgi:hypothetical protein
VRGKPFCRLWSSTEHERDGIHGTDVLVVFCDADEKQMLIETSAGALFSTPHYDGYPALLIRLADVHPSSSLNRSRTVTAAALPSDSSSSSMTA